MEQNVVNSNSMFKVCKKYDEECKTTHISFMYFEMKIKLSKGDTSITKQSQHFTNLKLKNDTKLYLWGLQVKCIS